MRVLVQPVGFGTTATGTARSFMTREPTGSQHDKDATTNADNTGKERLKVLMLPTPPIPAAAKLGPKASGVCIKAKLGIRVFDCTGFGGKSYSFLHCFASELLKKD